MARLNPVGLLPADQRLNLAITLPVRDADGLDRLLREIYDPASPNYRHYLTPAQFSEKFGADQADYAAITDFAITNHLTITLVHPNRLVLDVSAAVADIERAFHLRLHVYNHPVEARPFFAPDTEPMVDHALNILHISGLDNYSLPHPNRHVRPLDPLAIAGSGAGPNAGAGAEPCSGSGPSGTYRGADFRKAYVPGSTLTGAGQSVGLLEFDAYYPGDIISYETQIGLGSAVPQLVNVAVDGGVSRPGNGNGEVSLDIQMVVSMSPGVSNIYVYEAPNNSPWVDILSAMANDNLAKQLSCSWGGGGPDAASETIFKQMAAQGQSFFNASGDSDAFTGAIAFPSESPNIIQVGGTTLTTGSGAAYSSETVWNWGHGTGSGGGISTTYGIPVWQQGVSMASNQGSTTMRNMPDVALTADKVYNIYNNGTAGTVGGTSCAAPLWAAFTALANQRAAAAGLPPVGFLNPALYAIGVGPNYTACFHDVTTGNNTWSRSRTAFYAVAGYDLCTGWGTPNGTNLINALVPISTVVTRPLLSAPVLSKNSMFTFTLSGNAGFNYAIEASTNLSTWSVIATVSNSAGSLSFADTNSHVFTFRAYRARLLP